MNYYLREENIASLQNHFIKNRLNEIICFIFPEKSNISLIIPFFYSFLHYLNKTFEFKIKPKNIK
jgi:hypothetical protein